MSDHFGTLCIKRLKKAKTLKMKDELNFESMLKTLPYLMPAILGAF